MRVIYGFGRFWWDFVVGEDWRIAASVAAVLLAGALLVARTAVSDRFVTLACGAAIVASVVLSIVLPAIRERRRGTSRARSARATR